VAVVISVVGSTRNSGVRNSGYSAGMPVFTLERAFQKAVAMAPIPLPPLEPLLLLVDTEHRPTEVVKLLLDIGRTTVLT